ncbi:MAG TPA: Gfo/Idh/MocA family oxidoreductase [Candidatus Avipropionibacterium avicola]|uniref:Gfo/Idh/MocA family oxidoreductase n=1 Tax=Candidatus Avipropionibacterium avicola TaxID=2840701 RepID=A0A9D1KKW0_9ACTN|nr:Gfo/Idh/MocA family oxidoreductase [Candidatus Avipropionibacterium avicola]
MSAPTTIPAKAGGRPRYAVVGTGHRVEMYTHAIAGDHAEAAELVALLDLNPGRVEWHRADLAAAGIDTADIHLGGPDELEQVIAERQVDRVIVTTPDFTHAEMIVRSLRAGADVVVEKPLTIDAESARAIATAVRETGHSVVTTFNYRYSPRNSALKEVVQSGRIGTVLSVTFEWVLDTRHGADYFRRWHRYKDRSGGLLIHKASHHFDLVNWWIDDTPDRVYASGGLKFYGAENAERYGVAHPNPRGTHDNPERTPFELDLRHDQRLKELYLDNESHDGYLRDRDVFDSGITAEDTLAVVVDYEQGPVLSYSLVAHCPWEGYRVSINGTKGRAELDVVERPSVLLDTDGNTILDPSAVPEELTSTGRQRGAHLTVQNHWGVSEELTIPEGTGGHGGGDALLLTDLFRGPGEDPLGRPSSWIDGLRSAGVGMAGNESIRTGQPVRISDLGFGVDLSR